MKKVFVLVGLFFSCFSLSGCAPTISPNVYDSCEVGVARRVVPGVIVAKRVVCIDNHSGVGGPAGAAAGFVAGSAIGNTCASSVVGAVGGAIVGGIIGHQIDKTANHHQGWEYIVRLRHGPTVSIVQPSDMQFFVHQPVTVIYGSCGGRTRIVPRD